MSADLLLQPVCQIKIFRLKLIHVFFFMICKYVYIVHCNTLLFLLYVFHKLFYYFLPINIDNVGLLLMLLSYCNNTIYLMGWPIFLNRDESGANEKNVF